MSHELRVQAGPLTIAIEGADGQTSTPAVEVFRRLPPAAEGASTDLRIVFVPGLRTAGRAARPVGRHPLYAAPGGLVVMDHLGHEAHLPLGSLDTDAVTIDPDLDLHILQTWVQLPVLRLALHRAGGGLVRCSVFDLAGRRVGMVAPARVGKTRLMLALLRDGASLVGDDWVAVAADGEVAPACRLVVVRDEARSDTARRSTRAVFIAALRRLSARTARARRLSLALAQAADLAWRWGQQVRDVGTVVPGVSVSERMAPIDEIILFDTPVAPRTGAVSTDVIAELVAAAGVAELPEQFLLEAVYRGVHPGTLSPAALPGRDDDEGCVRRALQGARMRSLAYDGSTADVGRVTRLLATEGPATSRPGGQGVGR